MLLAITLIPALSTWLPSLSGLAVNEAVGSSRLRPAFGLPRTQMKQAGRSPPVSFTWRILCLRPGLAALNFGCAEFSLRRNIRVRHGVYLNS